jgi:CBS domain-containing protein
MSKAFDSSVIFEKTVSDLMLHDAVVSCIGNATVEEVVAVMVENNIGSIVIVEGKRPIGIFTERDLLKKVVPKKMDVSRTLISSIMTPNPVCIDTSTSIHKIMAAMRLGKFRHLVVTHPDGSLKGVVSIKDVLTFLTDQLNT